MESYTLDGDDLNDLYIIGAVCVSVTKKWPICFDKIIFSEKISVWKKKIKIFVDFSNFFKRKF